MNRALFLDRDGVINVEKGYVHRIEDFEFASGIFKLCRTAQDFGIVPIVITNQAGTAAGVGYNIKLTSQSRAGSSPDILEFRSLHAIGVWLRRTFGRPAPG